MRRLAIPATFVLVTASLVGCRLGQTDLIALLLPDDRAERWVQVDQPAFEQAVADQCTGCEVRVWNAGGDPERQAAQLDEALDAGADVVVLGPAEADAAADLVVAAGEVPVVAYDRFVTGADYYVSFDGAAVGRLQAEVLVAAAGERPRILVLNGGVDDPNAAELKRAARAVLDEAGVTVLAEEDPADWDTATARAWVEAQLAELGDARIDAVYAANDNQAAGVVAAFRAAGRPLPVITGQDAQLDALRRIVAGTQTMTVYKPIPAAADRAASIAVGLLARRRITGTTDYEGVPSIVLAPAAVTRDNLANTVVRDGAVDVDELCAGALRPRCERLGLI